MLFSTPLTLLMALAPATIYAAPTPTRTSTLSKRAIITLPPQPSVCNLAAAVMPIAPTGLPAPANQDGLFHIAVGRGTQNYTCSSTPYDPKSAPKALGATASLYNVTCLNVIAPMIFNDISRIALTLDPSTTQGPVSGHHFFSAGGSPVFKTDFGWMQAKAAANSTAPTSSDKGKNGLGSVPWLKLTGTAGDFKEVYRLNTAGGVAPKTCEGLDGTFEVQYAALYWFYK